VMPLDDLRSDRLRRADEWILERLDEAIRECDRAIGPVRPGRGVWLGDELTAGLRLNDYAETARRFVWNELADWYLEAIKTRLLTAGDDQEVARAVLVHVFDRALRLLHPIVPFITEALWQRLPGHVDGPFLAIASWPTARSATEVSVPAGQFELLRSVVAALRTIRSEYNVPPGMQIEAFVVTTEERRRLLDEEFSLVNRLARTALAFVEWIPDVAGANVILPGGTQLVVPLEGLVDVKKECQRLRIELGTLEKQLTSLEARLQNSAFVERAPAHVIDSERAKRDEWSARRGQLRTRIEALCGGG
jgi:valyl-tRNA synthetase